MKSILRIALWTLAGFFAVCAQAQTTYQWTVEPSGQSYIEGAAGGNHLMQTVPAITTTATIVNSRDTGCATNIIDTINVTNGGAPLVGEYAQASGGFQPYIYEILDVSLNSDGTYDITLSGHTCEGFPVRTGIEQLGPALRWYLAFNYPGARSGNTCNSVNSSVTAGFLDASGNLQSAPSAPGTVTCTLSGSYPNLIAAVSFSGTDSLGNAFTATATINSQQGGRGNEYAISASWDPFLTGGGTGGGGKSVSSLYLCGSERKSCFKKGR